MQQWNPLRKRGSIIQGKNEIFTGSSEEENEDLGRVTEAVARHYFKCQLGILGTPSDLDDDNYHQQHELKPNETMW